MSFENRLRKDITDQQQASSSGSESPDRLQKMRNMAYIFTKKYNKGKDSMTPEMQMGHNKAQQEKWDNGYRESTHEIIKQRVGKTSSGSEIQLGYKK